MGGIEFSAQAGNYAKDTKGWIYKMGADGKWHPVSSADQAKARENFEKEAKKPQNLAKSIYSDISGWGTKATFEEHIKMINEKNAAETILSYDFENESLVDAISNEASPTFNGKSRVTAKIEAYKYIFNKLIQQAKNKISAEELKKYQKDMDTYLKSNNTKKINETFNIIASRIISKDNKIETRKSNKKDDITQMIAFAKEAKQSLKGEISEKSKNTAKEIYDIVDNNNGSESMKKLSTLFSNPKKFNPDNAIEIITYYNQGGARQKDDNIIDSILSEKHNDKYNEKTGFMQGEAYNVIYKIINTLQKSCQKAGVSPRFINEARNKYKQEMKDLMVNGNERFSEVEINQRYIDTLISLAGGKNVGAFGTFEDGRAQDNGAGALGDAVIGAFGGKTISGMTRKLGKMDRALEKLNFLAEQIDNKYLTEAQRNEYIEQYKQEYKNIYGVEFNPKLLAEREELQQKVATIKVNEELQPFFDNALKQQNVSDIISALQQCKTIISKTDNGKNVYLYESVKAQVDAYKYANNVDDATAYKEILKMMKSEYNKAANKASGGQSYADMEARLNILNQSCYGKENIGREVAKFNENQAMTQAYSEMALDIAATVVTAWIPGAVAVGGAKIAATLGKMANTGTKMAKFYTVMAKAANAAAKTGKAISSAQKGEAIASDTRRMQLVNKAIQVATNSLNAGVTATGAHALYNIGSSQNWDKNFEAGVGFAKFAGVAGVAGVLAKSVAGCTNALATKALAYVVIEGGASFGYANYESVQQFIEQKKKEDPNYKLTSEDLWNCISSDEALMNDVIMAAMMLVMHSLQRDGGKQKADNKGGHGQSADGVKETKKQSITQRAEQQSATAAEQAAARVPGGKVSFDGSIETAAPAEEFCAGGLTSNSDGWSGVGRWLWDNTGGRITSRFSGKKSGTTTGVRPKFQQKIDKANIPANGHAKLEDVQATASELLNSAKSREEVAAVESALKAKGHKPDKVITPEMRAKIDKKFPIEQTTGGAASADGAGQGGTVIIGGGKTLGNKFKTMSNKELAQEVNHVKNNEQNYSNEDILNLANELSERIRIEGKIPASQAIANDRAGLMKEIEENVKNLRQEGTSSGTTASADGAGQGGTVIIGGKPGGGTHVEENPHVGSTGAPAQSAAPKPSRYQRAKNWVSQKTAQVQQAVKKIRANKNLEKIVSEKDGMEYTDYFDKNGKMVKSVIIDKNAQKGNPYKTVIEYDSNGNPTKQYLYRSGRRLGSYGKDKLIGTGDYTTTDNGYIFIEKDVKGNVVSIQVHENPNGISTNNRRFIYNKDGDLTHIAITNDELIPVKREGGEVKIGDDITMTEAEFEAEFGKNRFKAPEFKVPETPKPVEKGGNNPTNEVPKTETVREEFTQELETLKTEDINNVPAKVAELAKKAKNKAELKALEDVVNEKLPQSESCKQALEEAKTRLQDTVPAETPTDIPPKRPVELEDGTFATIERLTPQGTEKFLKGAKVEDLQCNVNSDGNGTILYKKNGVKYQIKYDRNRIAEVKTEGPNGTTTTRYKDGKPFVPKSVPETDTKFQELNETLESKKSAVLEKEQALSETDAEISRLTDEQTAMRDEHFKMKQKEHELEQEKEKLGKEYETLRDDTSEPAKKRKAEIDEEVDRIETEELEPLKEKIAERENEIATKQTEIDNAVKKRKTQLDELNEAKNERDKVQDKVDNYEPPKDSKFKKAGSRAVEWIKEDPVGVLALGATAAAAAAAGGTAIFGGGDSSQSLSATSEISAGNQEDEITQSNAVEKINASTPETYSDIKQQILDSDWYKALAEDDTNRLQINNALSGKLNLIVDETLNNISNCENLEALSELKGKVTEYPWYKSDITPEQKTKIDNAFTEKEQALNSAPSIGGGDGETSVTSEQQAKIDEFTGKIDDANATTESLGSLKDEIDADTTLTDEQKTELKQKVDDKIAELQSRSQNISGSQGGSQVGGGSQGGSQVGGGSQGDRTQDGSQVGGGSQGGGTQDGSQVGGGSQEERTEPSNDEIMKATKQIIEYAKSGTDEDISNALSLLRSLGRFKGRAQLRRLLKDARRLHKAQQQVGNDKKIEKYGKEVKKHGKSIGTVNDKYELTELNEQTTENMREQYNDLSPKKKNKLHKKYYESFGL